MLRFNERAYSTGHLLTDYDRWANATAPYEIDYQLGYEPWGISHRCGLGPWASGLLARSQAVEHLWSSSVLLTKSIDTLCMCTVTLYKPARLELSPSDDIELVPCPFAGAMYPCTTLASGGMEGCVPLLQAQNLYHRTMLQLLHPFFLPQNPS